MLILTAAPSAYCRYNLVLCRRCVPRTSTATYSAAAIASSVPCSLYVAHYRAISRRLRGSIYNHVLLQSFLRHCVHVGVDVWISNSPVYSLHTQQHTNAHSCYSHALLLHLRSCTQRCCVLFVTCKHIASVACVQCMRTAERSSASHTGRRRIPHIRPPSRNTVTVSHSLRCTLRTQQ